MTINTAITTLLSPRFFALPQPLKKRRPKRQQPIFPVAAFGVLNTTSKINGVTDVISGYMGGHVKDPSYKEVASGTTGHYEVVKVYDQATVSYQNLLSAFWRMHDLSDGGGSFCDRGQQYSTAAFYGDATQKTLWRVQSPPSTPPTNLPDRWPRKFCPCPVSRRLRLIIRITPSAIRSDTTITAIDAGAINSSKRHGPAMTVFTSQRNNHQHNNQWLWEGEWHALGESNPSFQVENLAS